MSDTLENIDAFANNLEAALQYSEQDDADTGSLSERQRRAYQIARDAVEFVRASRREFTTQVEFDLAAEDVTIQTALESGDRDLAEECQTIVLDSRTIFDISQSSR